MKFEPKVAEGEALLRALDPTESAWTFQTIDDNKRRADRALLCVRYGNLETHADALTALNRRGAGIFFAVNELNPGPRLAKHVVRVRAAFADLDGAPLERALAPKLIVESSPGRYHAYWPVAGMPLGEFGRVQKEIASRCGSDPSVYDLPRVMRLPGFYHQKVAKNGDRSLPFLSRLIHVEGGEW